MKLKMKGYKLAMVDSLQAASRIFEQRRDDSGLGASEFVDGFVFEDDVEIARISYNGRVWPPGDYKPDAIPLYDNRR